MTTFDRLKHYFLGLVETALARTDYHALYPARVVSQNSDGTLELRPDSPRWGSGLSRVPIRHGVPGVTRLEVAQGARVHLGFVPGPDGIPEPYAALWEKGSLTKLTIEASTQVVVICPDVVLGSEEGASPVARLGDVVECLLPPQIPVVGTVGPPPGAPFVGMLTITDPILGVIDSAALNVRAK